jgi:hypothetical protein
VIGGRQGGLGELSGPLTLRPPRRRSPDLDELRRTSISRIEGVRGSTSLSSTGFVQVRGRFRFVGTGLLIICPQIRPQDGTALDARWRIGTARSGPNDVADDRHARCPVTGDLPQDVGPDQHRGIWRGDRWPSLSSDAESEGWRWGRLCQSIFLGVTSVPGCELRRRHYVADRAMNGDGTPDVELVSRASRTCSPRTRGQPGRHAGPHRRSRPRDGGAPRPPAAGGWSQGGPRRPRLMDMEAPNRPTTHTGRLLPARTRSQGRRSAGCVRPTLTDPGRLPRTVPPRQLGV